MVYADAVFLLDHFGRYRGRYKTRWTLEDPVQDVKLFCSLRQNDPEFDGVCWFHIGF